MNLVKQVTSVALSNRLHELGVTTSSLYYREWTGAKEDEIEMWAEKDGDFCEDNVNCYSVAELGEMLPYEAESGKTFEGTVAADNFLCLDFFFAR